VFDLSRYSAVFAIGTPPALTVARQRATMTNADEKETRMIEKVALAIVVAGALMTTVAHAAPRGQDVQAPRGQDVQAPRAQAAIHVEVITE
jgi:hypothetical protein